MARVYTGGRGPVAQLVEQGTFNPKVTGSIPVRPIELVRCSEKCATLVLAEGLPCNARRGLSR